MRPHPLGLSCEKQADISTVGAAQAVLSPEASVLGHCLRRGLSPTASVYRRQVYSGGVAEGNHNTVWQPQPPLTLSLPSVTKPSFALSTLSLLGQLGEPGGFGEPLRAWRGGEVLRNETFFASAVSEGWWPMVGP